MVDANVLATNGVMSANNTAATFVGSERGGLTATVVCASISLVSVLVFLLYFSIRSGWQLIRRRTATSSLMGDRHMASYFVCVLIANVFKSLSVVISVVWIDNHLVVRDGPLCTAQAALKLVGNVGSAVWSAVIALHVFQLLFLELRTIKWGLPAMIAAVWSLLIADVMIGPVFIDRVHFYGPDPHVANGSTCWITEAHGIPRFLLEYLPTGLSLAAATVMLGMTLLHLRGNIYYTGGRMKVRWVSADDAWHDRMTRDAVDAHVLRTVSAMIWFPISYFVLWAPVMVSRLIDLTKKDQPFGFVAFALSCYALTGFADVLIFLLTQHILIPRGVVAPAIAVVDEKIADPDAKLPPAYSEPEPFPRALLLRGDSGSSRYSGKSGKSAGFDFVVPKAVAPPTSMSDVSMIRTGVRHRSGSDDFVMVSDREGANSSSPRPTNFLSIGSDTARSFPSEEDDGGYAASGIVNAYARPSGVPPMSAFSTPSAYSASLAGTNTSLGIASSGARSGWAARADEEAVVQPLGAAETYKARLYGARFSLVAGPAMQYNADWRGAAGVGYMPGQAEAAPGPAPIEEERK